MKFDSLISAEKLPNSIHRSFVRSFVSFADSCLNDSCDRIDYPVDLRDCFRESDPLSFRVDKQSKTKRNEINSHSEIQFDSIRFERANEKQSITNYQQPCNMQNETRNDHHLEGPMQSGADNEQQGHQQSNAPLRRVISNNDTAAQEVTPPVAVVIPTTTTTTVESDEVYHDAPMTESALNNTTNIAKPASFSSSSSLSESQSENDNEDMMEESDAAKEPGMLPETHKDEHVAMQEDDGDEDDDKHSSSPLGSRPQRSSSHHTFDGANSSQTSSRDWGWFEDVHQSLHVNELVILQQQQSQQEKDKQQRQQKQAAESSTAEGLSGSKTHETHDMGEDSEVAITSEDTTQPPHAMDADHGKLRLRPDEDELDSDDLLHKLRRPTNGTYVWI